MRAIMFFRPRRTTAFTQIHRSGETGIKIDSNLGQITLFTGRHAIRMNQNTIRARWAYIALGQISAPGRTLA